MNKIFSLSDYSTTYSTRAKADEIANNLNEYIKNFRNDDVLQIEFTGVKAISYSFLDQFLSRVGTLPLLKDRKISISGWSQDLFPVIDKSLQHRSYLYETKSEQMIVCQA